MTFDEMPRVDAVWRHPLFQGELARIVEMERERRFCRHGLVHLLDVARIMRIAALEQGLELPRDVLYATALLHDIGRAAERETGEPHDVAGVRIAGEILGTVGEGRSFSEEERRAMLRAIGAHRERAEVAREPLSALLFAADKASRACFACPARPECAWPEEKMNLSVRV